MLLLLYNKYSGHRDVHGRKECHFQEWLIKALSFSFDFYYVSESDPNDLGNVMIWKETWYLKDHV